MSTSTTRILVTAALMSAGTITMLSCAKIIGADFNRTFDGVGGGLSASAVDASSSSEASSSSTGTGGESPELCDLGTVGEGEENLIIRVYAHENVDDGGSSEQRFYSTREGLPSPTNDYGLDLGSYELFRQGGLGRVPVFQCLGPTSYYVGTKAEVGDGSCECLGYAAKTNTGKKLRKLVGDTPQKSAYTTDGLNCLKYGYHSDVVEGCVGTNLASASK